MAKSRRSKSYSPNDVLFTPPEIFEALGVTFDLDVCSPSGGLPWIPAKRFIDESENGLASEWYGTVWMNPPYSNPTPWIDKWLAHKNGFALVPFSRANWFVKLWDSESVCWAVHRSITFINPQGIRKGIFMPVGLWAIGETNITALKMSGLGVIR